MILTITTDADFPTKGFLLCCELRARQKTREKVCLPHNEDIPLYFLFVPLAVFTHSFQTLNGFRKLSRFLRWENWYQNAVIF